ncbi:hypothetical protein ASD01_17485 [Ensifer sp. Root423]|uniref:hypothetical protein n=1 Tax=Ensifer sp. Root423 TaxID=1736534 RepID=UPI000713B2C0|nr:hypothetical protein [Ensifer sp. Root423]KQX03067.1 hypothetical protein ASD01_17485 [Ensifer sp. Root423]
MNSLFEPYELAWRTLHNRFVPMTRARAKDGIADPETALYSVSVQVLDRDRRNADLAGGTGLRLRSRSDAQVKAWRA